MPLNPIALAVKVSDSALCADSAVQNYAVAAAHAAVSLLCPCEGNASPSDYTDATKPAEGLVKAMSNYLMQVRREAEHAAPLDPEKVASWISRAGDYHAHANTRTHAVAAAHAALAILTEGTDASKVGAALVKEISKWLEETRRETLLQASRTVADLR
jgi:hypothetical protein